MNARNVGSEIRRYEPTQRFGAQSPIVGYAVAVASVVAAMLMRAALAPVLGEDAPLIIFLLPVMITAVYGGTWPAMLATVLGGLAGLHFFVEPGGGLLPQSPVNLARTAIFFSEGALASWLVGSRREGWLAAAATATELRKRESGMRAIFENAPVGIARVAPDGRWLQVNDALCDILGYSRQELFTRTFGDITHPDDLDADWELARRLLAGELETYSMQKRYFRRNGAAVWTTLTVSLVRDEKGQSDYFIAVVEDITERVQAEAAVQEREAQLRRIIDNMLGFVAMLDKEGTLLEVGEPALRVGGLQRKEVIGRKFWECPWWSHDETLRNEMKQWIAGAVAGDEVRRDVVVRTAGDGRLAVDFMLTPAFDANGNVASLIASGVDISARKRMEEALIAADRRKDEFLATLSHELRNPLAPIRSAAHVLQQPNLGASQQEWCRKVIDRQVRHMARLLDDLLDISRITQGKMELRKEVLSICTVFEAAAETAQPLINARGHKLTLELPQEEVTIFADSVRLTQILGNLLSNAAKYTDPGGCIRLGATVRDREVSIFVEDNGIGMAEEALSRIFDMFSRSPGAIGFTESGLGIGLALSKALAELHGGRIEAHSKGPGEGSRFVVRLPRHV